MSADLTLVCRGCGRPIEGDTGSLFVTYEAIAERRRLEAAWNAEHGDGLISGAALMLYPETVHWRAYHYACDPERELDSYWIGAERLRTWRDLARWTAHLMAKRWFPLTDWDCLLREASGENQAVTLRVLERAA